MRHIEQLGLTAPWIDHEHASELATISELLDAQPRLAALIQQDLLAACHRNPRTGRAGLTGDQALRILVARQLAAFGAQLLSAQIPTIKRSPQEYGAQRDWSALVTAQVA